jgi:hypothetical protein
MLAYLLAITVALGSLAIYIAAFFFQGIHRKSDFYWSGVGLFYALVLWICAGRITGGLLLGQIAGVALLGSFVWQTLVLRRELLPAEQRAGIPNPEELQQKLSQLPIPDSLKQLPKQIGGAFSGVQTTVQQTIAKFTQRSPKVDAPKNSKPSVSQQLKDATADVEKPASKPPTPPAPAAEVPAQPPTPAPVAEVPVQPPTPPAPVAEVPVQPPTPPAPVVEVSTPPTPFEEKPTSTEGVVAEVLTTSTIVEDVPTTSTIVEDAPTTSTIVEDAPTTATSVEDVATPALEATADSTPEASSNEVIEEEAAPAPESTPPAQPQSPESN